MPSPVLPRGRRFIRRLLLLAAVSALLQGCSGIRLAYDNADSLARWWLDKYVDLSEEQDALTRDRLTRIHARHRKTQLPDYLAVLRQGQQFVAGRPTAADALAIVDRLIRHGRALAELAAPDVADFLPTLSDAQIGRMAARMEEKNAEYAEEAQLADGESGRRDRKSTRLNSSH